MQHVPPPSTTRIDPAPTLTRRRFLTTATLSAAALALYSGEIARHELELIHYPIVLRNLPPAFEGFRIAHISDLHFEEYTEPFFLHRMIREVNALTPDLILITGDFITHGPPRSVPERAIYTVADALRALTCPQRLGILGNHDCTVSASFIARVLRDRGTPILTNQHTTVERNGQRITIAGVLDPLTSFPNLTQAVPDQPDGPVILMAHTPDYADLVRHHSRGHLVDLILSGHSHGGQVRLPGIGPLILPPLGKKYVHGHFQFDNLQLYVNRGLGSVGLPFRLNCPPEITLLTLQSA